MTATLPGADIRGFYAALGVDLPGWSRENAPARCFADPDAHTHQDRTPSTSVDLTTGAWCCHGCGARGSARSAATAVGHSDRSADDLMVRYGLARRGGVSARAQRTRTSSRSRAGACRRPQRVPRLNISEAEIQRWHRALLGDRALLGYLRDERGWTEPAILELQLGLDRGKITIPVRDHDATLVSLLRYQPDGSGKMRTAIGSLRTLFPHPAFETARELLLVEGEPDAIAARSRRLPAIAIPGVSTWRAAWAELLAGRDVTVALDADMHGRTCAAEVVADLRRHAHRVSTVDLAPDRDDGYDLTDWLTDHPSDAAAHLAKLKGRP